jgi:hypothetical protein
MRSLPIRYKKLSNQLAHTQTQIEHQQFRSQIVNNHTALLTKTDKFTRKTSTTLYHISLRLDNIMENLYENYYIYHIQDTEI